MKDEMPVCLWVTTNYAEKLPIIADERICGDTFLKVEQIDSQTFLVSDIWMYNSNCVFACSTFEQRYNWLKDLLKTFTSHIDGVTIKLLHKSDYTGAIKGYEEHPTDMPGKPGYYVEDESKSETVNVIRMNNEFKNTHNVPEDVIQKMKDRFEDYADEIVVKNG